MTIIQQPDNLSLSLNLKSYILKSAKSITFELKKGADLLLSQRYTPGADQQVEVDLRDVIHASLFYELRDVAETYEQAGIVADFVAVIDGHPHTFRVLRGGVDRLADTATNFLKGNWLTWQPTEKKVTYHSPEFLTYYAVEACVVKLKAYFSDTDSQVITVGNLAAGKAYTLPMQYGVVVGKLANRLPGVYDVWVETPAGARLTYIQRYRAEGMKSLHEDWMLFENSLGGLDTFRAYGVKGLESKHTHNVANLGDDSEEYDVDTQRVFSKETGYLTADEMKWLLDFFPSLKKYIYTGNYLRRITVLESDVNYENLFAPESYKFSYVFSDARPLLNLPREDQGAEVLDIVIPNVGNFTLPPRLNEVGRIPLSEGVLFPVQHPYSEKWGTTNIASIATAIGELLEAQASGGGVGHRHGNIDLLNAMQMLGEYLTVFGKKLSAGYADIAGDVVDGKFIRKNRPDTTEHLLRLLGGAHVGNAVDSMTAGAGTVMTADGRIQTNRMEVRESLTVMELIINRLSALEGDQLLTESDSIEKVDDLGNNCYGLHLRRKWEGYFTAQAQGNVLKGIINSLAAGSGTYYTCWMRVNSVNTVNNYIEVTVYPDAEVPGGKNYLPCRMMKVARWGNQTDTARQSCIYLSSSEGRIVRLTGVTKPIIDATNYGSTLGTLPDFLKAMNLPIVEGQDYLYARGIVTQDIIRIDYQGKPISEIIDRGIWSAKGDYYHETRNPMTGKFETSDVWFMGCKWRCLKTGVKSTPAWNNTSWAMVEGNPEFTVDFAELDYLFDPDNFAQTLTIVAKLYNQDVTADILPADVAWTRYSEDNNGMERVESDKAWAIRHTNTGKQLQLTVADCDFAGYIPKALRFIATVTLRDGIGNEQAQGTAVYQYQ